MGLALTVLGASCAAPNPNGANAGYLVVGGGARLLLDCGSGVAGRLRAFGQVTDLDAILVSHLHPDHYLDLVTFRQVITYFLPPRARPLPVFLPPGGLDLLERLGRAVGGDPGWFAGAFDLAEYEPRGTLRFGALTVHLRPVQHYIPSHAMRLEAAGRVLVYSSDLAPCAAIVEHARGANLLLCEAALFRPGDDRPDPAQRGHTAPEEAGAIARDAGVERLLLTHYALAPDQAARLDAVRARFAGPVAWAEEGQTYPV